MVTLLISHKGGRPSATEDLASIVCFEGVEVGQNVPTKPIREPLVHMVEWELP